MIKLDKKCHFIGIGGIGMSGLAKILLHRNHQVSGSDIAASAVTEGLEKSGAKVFVGHASDRVQADMTVVYSTDIQPTNPEYLAAKEMKCHLIHRSELLGLLMHAYQSFAIAGTHGKTTTSSLLTWVLESSGLSPSYAVGGVIPQLLSNAGTGKGSHFVAEACESDGSFLNYHPFGAIVTNIDFDHMNNYASKEAHIAAFVKFMSQVKSSEHLFWCRDDPHLTQANSSSPTAVSRIIGISYGFHPESQLRASAFVQNGWTISFDIAFRGNMYRQVEVALTGRHNALNSLAVFGLALSIGIPEAEIRRALRSFGGVCRRCEKKGERHGVEFYDDYGHHPTEISATLKAVRSAVGERRLVVVYQPHRYTRAIDCQGLYGGVFSDADGLFITEIYAAGETPIPGVSHEQIIREAQADLGPRCYGVARAQAAAVLADFLQPGDVCLTLGAGDIHRLYSEIRENTLAIKT